MAKNYISKLGFNIKRNPFPQKIIPPPPKKKTCVSQGVNASISKENVCLKSFGGGPHCAGCGTPGAPRVVNNIFHMKKLNYDNIFSWQAQLFDKN